MTDIVPTSNYAIDWDAEPSTMEEVEVRLRQLSAIEQLTRTERAKLYYRVWLDAQKMRETHQQCGVFIGTPYTSFNQWLENCPVLPDEKSTIYGDIRVMHRIVNGAGKPVEDIKKWENMRKLAAQVETGDDGKLTADSAELVNTMFDQANELHTHHFRRELSGKVEDNCYFGAGNVVFHPNTAEFSFDLEAYEDNVKLVLGRLCVPARLFDIIQRSWGKFVWSEDDIQRVKTENKRAGALWKQVEDAA